MSVQSCTTYRLAFFGHCITNLCNTVKVKKIKIIHVYFVLFGQIIVTSKGNTPTSHGCFCIYYRLG
jgi:hypothetical protein